MVHVPPIESLSGCSSQMDVQVGRLRQLLEDRNLAEDTMLWYTADNGPHCGAMGHGSGLISAARDRSSRPEFAATNGLRQCKGSLYEGGIREPGILQWPAVIKRHAETWHPAYGKHRRPLCRRSFGDEAQKNLLRCCAVNDYLPTFLAVVGMAHPQPAWASDGMSLLPLITALGAQGGVDFSRRPAAHPLVFELGKQSALIDNEMKILRLDPQSDRQSDGHCPLARGSFSSGTHLFNLSADASESTDLSTSPSHAALFRSMSQRLEDFRKSVAWSAEHESQCAPPSAAVGASRPQQQQIMPACTSALKDWSPKPAPTGPGFELRVAGGQCMTAVDAAERTAVTLAPCAADGAQTRASVQRWAAAADGKLFLDGGSGNLLCPKPNYTSGHDECAAGAPTWLGESCDDPHGLLVANGSGTVRLAKSCSPPMCLLHSGADRGALRLGLCSDPAAQGWTMRSLLKTDDVPRPYTCGCQPIAPAHCPCQHTAQDPACSENRSGVLLENDFACANSATCNNQDEGTPGHVPLHFASSGIVFPGNSGTNFSGIRKMVILSRCAFCSSR